MAHDLPGAEVHATGIGSPIGKLTLVADREALRVVTWTHSVARHRRVAEAVKRALPAAGVDHPILSAAIEQLDEYFAGHRRSFDLPMRAEGTEFQLTAWKVLSRIPYGQTLSYAEQAAQAGSPRATRAVGAANGRNPLAIVVPCHRVIGADGSLTGFGGGMDTKGWLLDHERRVLAGD